MSPDNFYNEQFLERQVIVQDIRHDYGFIFTLVERIFSFYEPSYNKKLSKKAEDIETRIQILYKDKEISEYLYKNYFAIIKHYSSLLPGELAKEKIKVGEDKQFERLKNLKTLLEIYIGDLSDELSDIIKASVDYERKRLVDEYFN